MIITNSALRASLVIYIISYPARPRRIIVKYTFCLVSLLFSLISNGVESHCNADGVVVHLMLFVSIKCFAGKGFRDIFCLRELSYVVY